MTIRKFHAFSAALFLPLAASAGAQPAAAPAAAPATAPQPLRVGTVVTDTQGGPVGTVTAINGTTVTLRTDRHEVALPVASFTPTPTGALFGMTQADLNTQVDAANAAAQQAFAVGSVVRDVSGAVVGPVRSLDATTVTITIGANVVRVPRAALAARPDGLVTGATLAQLRSASVPAPAEEPAAAAEPATPDPAQ